MSELLFRGHRVMLDSAARAASVRVREGRIVSVEEMDALPNGAEVVDVGEAMLLPGLVDTHVHVNEPGRTEWEGFRTATTAAAAGGVTTLLDMPLNCIPATTTARALHDKVLAARGQCHVDVGFIGGVVPGNSGDLEALHDAGIVAWKCFLVDSGVPEFAAIDERGLREALPILSQWDAPLMVHAELPGPIARARRDGVLRSHAAYAATRPEQAEIEAIALMIRLAGEFGARVHIVHLASRDAIALIDRARSQGVPLTVETCPHYLTFAGEDIPDGATEFKCAPPIRSAGHRQALWDALGAGTIDSIASDHSPSPPALKRRADGDFAAAWGGIASLQCSLSAVWHGARTQDILPTRVAEWMATQPAKIVRLAQKGRIAPGCDADLVVWDPAAEWMVEGSRLFHRHPLTPYEGMRLPGRVLQTYLRGRLIHSDGQPVGTPQGRLLLAER
jgi:allantoinase